MWSPGCPHSRTTQYTWQKLMMLFRGLCPSEMMHLERRKKKYEIEPRNTSGINACGMSVFLQHAPANENPSPSIEPKSKTWRTALVWTPIIPFYFHPLLLHNLPNSLFLPSRVDCWLLISFRRQYHHPLTCGTTPLPYLSNLIYPNLQEISCYNHSIVYNSTKADLIYNVSNAFIFLPSVNGFFPLEISRAILGILWLFAF